MIGESRLSAFFCHIKGSCFGQSGGPVVRRVDNSARQEYYEQHFIVSTGLDNCKKLEATLYTKVANREILTWIQKETDTTPLLLVYGGYNGTKNAFNNPDGILNDVELISTTKPSLCSKRVQPVQGDLLVTYDPVDEREIVLDSASTLGPVGIYAKDAAIVCGGHGQDGDKDHCYEFDNNVNRYYNHWSHMIEFLSRSAKLEST